MDQWVYESFKWLPFGLKIITEKWKLRNWETKSRSIYKTAPFATSQSECFPVSQNTIFHSISSQMGVLQATDPPDAGPCRVLRSCKFGNTHILLSWVDTMPINILKILSPFRERNLFSCASRIVWELNHRPSFPRNIY